jgi:phenol hydroxylase P0 protein
VHRLDRRLRRRPWEEKPMSMTEPQGAPPRSTAAVEAEAFVRLLSTKRDAWVEFEFALGDPELSVELVLPLEAFFEFCGAHSPRFLEPTPEAAAAFERLCSLRAPDGAVPVESPRR